MVVTMGKKTVIAILTVLVVILALVCIYYVYEAPEGDFGNSKMGVYSEGPMNLTDIIEDIETSSYYEGYDNNTLNWMKSLGQKAVFNGNGTFVIMDFSDANKIPSVFATDVIIIEHFRCDIVEEHSLGNVKYPKEVLLVKNVEYLEEEIIDLGLA